jgi:hypothetical protein
LLQELSGFACDMANRDKQTAVRLLEQVKQAETSKKANVDQLRFDLGVNHWVNFASSARKVGELLNNLLHKLKNNRLDLFVVEDLSQAKDAASSLPVQLRANAAHKTIRKLADQVGAAMICCLPMDEVDPKDSAWSNLEIYTDLRFVSRNSNNVIEITTPGGAHWLVSSNLNESEIIDDEGRAEPETDG